MSGAIIVVALILILIVFFILKSFYQLRYIFKFAWQHKGYRFIPIIGNGIHFLNNNLFMNVQTLIEKHGLPCNMWLGHNYSYITADAEEAKIILNNPNTLDKMSLYELVRILFDDTLLVAPAPIWKERRKFFSKSFSQSILKHLIPCFYRKSEIVLEVLKKSKGKDLFHVFENLSMDIFFENVFENDYKLQLTSEDTIAAHVENVQSLIGELVIYIICLPKFIWKRTSKGQKMFKSLDELVKFVKNFVIAKRQEFQTEPESNEASLPLITSMLKHQGEKFTDEQIFKEMILFAGAATDTSGFTLAYTFMLLGMHPDIQAKLYNEVISIVGHDHIISADDLPNLKYTERCINETMRILPATPYFGRNADKNIDLGTKIVPKGAGLFITVFNLHRNEKYWPDPLKYDPDRFLPEEVAKRHPYAFIPFSGGPRNCIGKTYAMMSMKITVANVIRHYEIYSKYKCVSELKFRSFITMKTDHPLHCEFKPRVQV